MTDVISTVVEGRIHNAPAEVWDVLARLFTPTINGSFQWVALEKDGARITFFGPDIPVTVDAFAPEAETA